MAERNRDAETTRSQGEKILGVQFQDLGQAERVGSKRCQKKKDKKLHRYKRATTREIAKIKGAIT